MFIAASIFAYGQTSSGKTYTMTGITEYAMEDIYDYIKRVQIPALAFQKQCRALVLSVVIRSLLLSSFAARGKRFCSKILGNGDIQRIGKRSAEH